MTTTNDDRRIKFTHGEDGMIGTYNGSTIFANLLMLGAFACTREYDDKIFYKKYQTDMEGLDKLRMKTQEAVTVLADTISALGEILVYVDIDNIDNPTLARFGWLISGLGELQSQLSFENSEITYALTKHEDMYAGVQS
jgi:hypothetical protein